jgi:glucose-6-phosphate isomerase
MSGLVELDHSGMGRFSGEAERDLGSPRVQEAVDSLRDRSGSGREFMGWLDLPDQREGLPELIAHAEELRKEIDTLVVVGIGGSYLGTRAVLEATRWRRTPKDPRVLFAGHHLEAHALAETLQESGVGEVAINVISKSGTTTEPAIAFRLLRDRLEKLYGPEKAARRIVATTDRERGALRTLVGQKGYRSYVVPDDVGGRFSVLTPVGLFPLAVAGCDVTALLDGARDEARRSSTAPPEENPALRYAVLRDRAFTGGIGVEVLASFHPSLHYVAEWWKQLYGESQGKEGRGLFPASVDYTTDLHSLGQFLQEGTRVLMETFVDLVDAPIGPVVPELDDDLDGLNYLAGRSVAEINREALPAVEEAHRSGGLPTQIVRLPDCTEPSLGSLLYFFEFAVAVGGRLLGINPFDQPGVEAYKTNLFRRLGKPGFD